MEDFLKEIIKMHLDDEIEKFFIDSSNGEKIDTRHIYFSHCVFVEQNGSVTDERYSAIIDSSTRTPHNRFFIDLINKEVLGIQNGWTGFSMRPNRGWSVDAFEQFNNEINKETITFEELERYIAEKNETLKTGMSK